MRNVLMIEADQQQLRERADQLLMDGYQVNVGSTAQAAWIRLAEAPDALVLCSASGGPETIALLRELRAGEIPRADCKLPVLVVGADDDSAAVRYYRAGADVALPAASSPLLVAAGLEALARRTDGEQERRRVLRVGSLTVDCDARVVQVDSRPVKVSRLEFDLLQTLARQPHKAFTRAELTRKVWGYDPGAAGPQRTVDSHVISSAISGAGCVDCGFRPSGGDDPERLQWVDALLADGAQVRPVIAHVEGVEQLLARLQATQRHVAGKQGSLRRVLPRDRPADAHVVWKLEQAEVGAVPARERGVDRVRQRGEPVRAGGGEDPARARPQPPAGALDQLHANRQPSARNRRSLTRRRLART